MANATKTSRIAVTISDEMKEKLEKICKEVGISKSAAAALAISEWVQRKSDEDKNSNR
jgi:predicted transcriptional regulator